MQTSIGFLSFKMRTKQLQFLLYPIPEAAGGLPADNAD